MLSRAQRSLATAATPAPGTAAAVSARTVAAVREERRLKQQQDVMRKAARVAAEKAKAKQRAEGAAALGSDEEVSHRLGYPCLSHDKRVKAGAHSEHGCTLVLQAVAHAGLSGAPCAPCVQSRL